MTKEEKIKALYEEYEKKSAEIGGQKAQVTQDDFKDGDWKSLRIECADTKDVSKAFSWLVGGFSDYVSDIFNGVGVYDMIICMKRSGDFDNSEEAKQLRSEKKAKQKALAEEFQKEVLKIEQEYIAIDGTECH